FCSYCMSWVFTRPNVELPFVNLRSTMLDDASWVVPYIESYVSEKLSWAMTPAVHSYDKFPEMNDYAALIEAYAAKGERPV
ncbi:MAG: aldehyde-activating protein, partial [Parvibaculum sp.]